MQTDTWTIGRLLTWTQEYLAEHNVDSPRLDAEVLLAEARDCQRIELYAAYHEEADERTRTAFRELVRRRAEGTPVAYLVGHREFYSMDFHVTPDVLIPRPETELVVLTMIERIRAGNFKQPRIADVGTGSGIIAVCMAKHVPDCSVAATDISPAALEVARTNAAAHGVEAQIDFLEGDLLEPSQGEFDFIASNPPYVADDEMASLAREVRDHEPERALRGGNEGLDVFKRLIPDSTEKLVSGAWLILEIGTRHDAVLQLIRANGNFEGPETIKDLSGLPRVIASRKR